MSTDKADGASAGPVRALVRYGPEGPDIVRLGEGVEGDTETIAFFRTVTGFEFEGEPYGRHRGSVHAFEGLDVVHVPSGPERGLVATIEGEGRTLPIDELIDLVERSARSAAVSEVS